MGPDPAKLREIARSVEEIMRDDPDMRTVNVDWGERVPKLHFVLDQERLQLIGLSPEAAAQQLQFLLNGQTITQVREDIRAVNIVARSAGPERLDPTKLENFTLTTRNGKPIPLSQIGRSKSNQKIHSSSGGTAFPPSPCGVTILRRPNRRRSLPGFGLDLLRFERRYRKTIASRWRARSRKQIKPIQHWLHFSPSCSCSCWPSSSFRCALSRRCGW